MYVNVGKPIPDQIVKEGEVEEAPLLPVLLGVGEHKVQGRHEQYVNPEEYQKGIVVARAKGVGEEDEDEEPAEDLEQNRQEQDDAVKDGGQVLVEGPPLEGGVVRGEAPRQAQDRRDDGDGLVRLDDGNVAGLADGEDCEDEGLAAHALQEGGKQQVQLDCRLEGRLQADLHDPRRRVQDLGRFYLLFSGHLFGPLGQVELSVVVVLDEQDGDGPEKDAARQGDGVKDELQVADDERLEPVALGHLLKDLPALGHQGLVVPGGEELVDEERPRDEDEEESVAKLGLGVHLHWKTLYRDVFALFPNITVEHCLVALHVVLFAAGLAPDDNLVVAHQLVEVAHHNENIGT